MLLYFCENYAEMENNFKLVVSSKLAKLKGFRLFQWNRDSSQVLETQSESICFVCICEFETVDFSAKIVKLNHIGHLLDTWKPEENLMVLIFYYHCWLVIIIVSSNMV